MPNSLSYVALVLWVPLTFLVFGRTTVARATVLTALGAILVLPQVAEFDLPGLPSFSKWSIPCAAILAALLVIHPAQIRRARPWHGVDVLFVGTCIGTLGTILTNTDVIAVGPRQLPALGGYDLFAIISEDLLEIYFPFFVARAAFRNARDGHVLVRTVVTLTLGYSLVCLFDMRFSPQLHRWIYGVHAGTFEGNIRFGGYRPCGLTGTGLELTLIMLAGALGAAGRWRMHDGRAATAAYLWAILILSKSMGTTLFSLIGMMAIAMGHRVALRLASAIAVGVLMAPAIKFLDLLPEDTLVAAANEVNEERGRSLWGRLDQDHLLLAHALERPVFGWGPFERNRILDPDSGEDLVVTDGYWTITLGTRGIVGFVTIFSLLAWPILLAWRRSALPQSDRERHMIAALALMTAFFALDLLPNGRWNYLPFFFAGALHGVVSGGRSLTRQSAMPTVGDRSGVTSKKISADGSRDVRTARDQSA